MTLEEVIAQVLRDSPKNINDGTGRQSHRRWDSFAQVEIVVAIEERYGVKFTNAEIEQMTSVSAIRAALTAKGMTP